MKKHDGVKVLLVIVLIAVATVLSVSPLANNLNLGLDLQGGAQVVLQAVPDEDEDVSKDDMQQLVTVLDQRVNELGVSEPIIQLEGEDRIIVELAGVDDPEAAIELIGKTAKLEFRDPNGDVILTGDMLETATAQVNPAPVLPREKNMVALKFNAEGTKLFSEATQRLLHQTISIYLDDELIQAPTVQSHIPNGEAVISGGFETLEDAAEIAALLRGGALPVNLEILSKSTVGPTLGADSLEKSLNAAAIGFIILLLYLLAYYRLPGAWAGVSLVFYTLILLWVMYLMKVTLTLTSIAGFILTVGMAVDSNIIIYERIREELFHGKSLKASIDAGFKRALWTILDSNITTLIAAVVLYFFGTGTIKGFALTLAIGLVASLFTAITFTRYMLRCTSNINALSNKKLYGM